MEKRIRIAHRLLADDGVIFCSIGDDEVAQLILLFNEIFREENKLGIISRISKTAGDQGNYFSSSKDYVIVYTKSKNLLANFKDEVDEGLFKKIEKEGPRKGEYYRDDVAFYQATLGVRPNLRYYVSCPDGSLVIPPGNVFPEEKRDGAKVIPKTDDDKVWRWSADKYLAEKHLIVFKQTKRSPCLDQNGNQSKWNIYTKSYLNERSEKGTSPRDYLDNFINRKGADFIKQYDIEFSYSKPFELIQHLIKISNKPNNIKVLDFFAGSGTTLHSVLNLNKIDNGQRTCILVTNNENNICEEVTYPRCHRIILKYVNSNGKEMPYFPNNNLRYFETEFVPSAKTEFNRRLLTRASTEMLKIKEECYTEITKESGLDDRYSCICTNKDGKYLVIVYHSRHQHEVIKLLCDFIQQIPDMKEKVKVYAFSPETEVLVEDFYLVMDKINAIPLPDAIYNAYRATFKTLKLDKKTFLPHISEPKEYVDSEIEETPVESELFDEPQEDNTL